MEIIRLKGATFYGIGACAADLVETVLLNKRLIHPVSVYVERLGVTLSMPAKIGWEGIQQVYEVPLNDEEEARLQASAKALREIQDLY
jgi:L-lactate dehydrogenase